MGESWKHEHINRHSHSNKVMHSHSKAAVVDLPRQGVSRRAGVARETAMEFYHIYKFSFNSMFSSFNLMFLFLILIYIYCRLQNQWITDYAAIILSVKKSKVVHIHRPTRVSATTETELVALN